MKLSSGPLLSPVQVSVALVLVFFALAYTYSLNRWRARSRGLLLPPGPKPALLIGNLFDFPTYKPWVAFRDLCLQYGDLLHFRILGQSILVLGSPNAISELLEKKSSNTSDRKQTPMIELCGASLNFGLTPYGSWWRRHRRAFQDHFREHTNEDHREIQRAFSHVFLEKLLTDPARFKEHIRYTFSASLLKIVYGIHADEENDEHMETVDIAVDAFAQGMVPGKFLVEFFPFLRHVPVWFPGARSQRLWAKWQDAGRRLKDAPFTYTDQKVVSQGQEDARQSVIGELLEKAYNESPDSFTEEVEIAKNVGATVFEAGSDTSFSALQAFFMAMSLHPEVLKNAQAELDAVVGPHRLPDFGDKEELVYINAIATESLRWHNGVPLCLAHSTTADDEFHGYFIPAGTVVLPNIWACMHDPEVYPDPDVFRPERFIRDGKLDLSVRDPSKFVFGFGRRMCPGRYFAHDSLFIHIASILHVFNIGPPLDESGRPVKIKFEQSDGFLSYPEDCRCSITPRSSELELLIKEYAAVARREHSRYA